MGELKYKLDMLKEPIWRFVNASMFAKDNLLYIQESGKFCSGKDYYTKRQGLDSYLIMYTVSGRGILEYNGEEYILTPGSVMFIDCKKPQNYRTEKTAGKWEMIWVHLNGKNIKAYYEKYLEKNDGSPVSMLSEDNSVNEIIENILSVSKAYSKDFNSDIIADNLLNSLLKECIIKSGVDSALAPDYVKETARFLRHHYSEEIDLDYLSREFNISKFHLQRKFNETMGCSPLKYLLNVRINRAKRLLRGTDLSVTDVAERIGIEPNYFIRLFKSTESVTPKQYRNKWCGK